MRHTHRKLARTAYERSPAHDPIEENGRVVAIEFSPLQLPSRRTQHRAPPHLYLLSVAAIQICRVSVRYSPHFHIRTWAAHLVTNTPTASTPGLSWKRALVLAPSQTSYAATTTGNCGAATIRSLSRRCPTRGPRRRPSRFIFPQTRRSAHLRTRHAFSHRLLSSMPIPAALLQTHAANALMSLSETCFGASANN